MSGNLSLSGDERITLGWIGRLILNTNCERKYHSMEANMEGGCACRQVRYRLIGAPLIVHGGSHAKRRSAVVHPDIFELT